MLPWAKQKEADLENESHELHLLAPAKDNIFLQHTIILIAHPFVSGHN